MTLRNTLLACTIHGAILLTALGSVSHARAAEACQPPKLGTVDVPIYSPPVSQVVKGKGKVQVYSAPNNHCPMKGAFVVPDDDVATSAQSSDGWSSITHTDPQTGEKISGWVRTSFLKEKGSIGPKHRLP